MRMATKETSGAKKPSKLKKIPHIRPKSIVITDDVMAGLEEHAYSNLEAEVGGMLFGTIVNGVATVVGAIPAAKATAEQISLTFTHEVWDDILNKGNEFFPGKQIVGWYHTHPSFGLFLSEYDEFIQKNFFANPGQFALVIDPIAGNLGWFELKKNGQIPLLAQEETKTGPKATPGIQATARAATPLNKVVVFASAAVLVTGAIGFGIGTMNAPVDLSSQVQALSQLLALKEGRFQGYVAINYTVRTGDTPESIAKTFYGDEEGLAQILEVNPSLDRKKENIKVGVVLLVVNPVGVSLYVEPEPKIDAPIEESPKPVPSQSVKPAPSKSPTEGSKK